MTNTRPTHSVLMTVQAITDAIDSARTQLDRARMLGLADSNADLMHEVALTLDAARTRLIQDGEEYLTASHLLLDSARAGIVAVMFAADKAGRKLAVGS